MPRVFMIRHLPYFLVVAEEQHVHRAAARLNITQSALSRRILDLETELGVTLFERKIKRGMLLNSVGRLLYEEVSRILGDIDHVVDRVHAMDRGKAGRLRISLNEDAAQNGMVTQGLSTFRARYGDVHIELYSSVTDEQLVMLENGEIDAGFLYEYLPARRLNKAFDFKEIATEQLLLAIPKINPIARRAKIYLKDLADENWIWPTRRFGSRIRDWMLGMCMSAGFTPKIVMETSTADATKNMVSAGLGVSFVTESGREPKQIVLRKVEDFTAPLSLRLVWRRGEEPPTVRRLVETFSSLRTPSPRKRTAKA